MIGLVGIRHARSVLTVEVTIPAVISFVALLGSISAWLIADARGKGRHDAVLETQKKHDVMLTDHDRMLAGQKTLIEAMRVDLTRFTVTERENIAAQAVTTATLQSLAATVAKLSEVQAEQSRSSAVAQATLQTLARDDSNALQLLRDLRSDLNERFGRLEHSVAELKAERA